ncbi:MAG: DUF6526 family protein [Acidobacteriota bacterium]|nr:DUF6526 family protein [Acidobacteriota bacterium]
MPDKPQTYNNHTRFDPPWHFFIAPMLLLNILFAAAAVVRHYPDHRHLYGWWTLMAVVLLLAVGRARAHSLVAQDRIIRLEERLRYATLLSPADDARAASLDIRQIIALRFASDAELPALIHRTLAENLTPRQIKQAITTWRPDHLRV